MKEKLQRFMIGRYGVDSFSKFLLGVILFFCIADVFFDNTLLTFLTLFLIFYVYFRMFSKNHSKRYEENLKFFQVKNKFLTKLQREKSHMEQRKTHHIYKCPTCKQKIRVPKGKGRICITCPKCKTEFTKTS